MDVDLLTLDNDDYNSKAFLQTAENTYADVPSTSGAALTDLTHVYIMPGDQSGIVVPEQQAHELWTKAKIRNNFAACGINMNYFQTLHKLNNNAPIVVTYGRNNDPYLQSSTTPIDVVNTGPRDIKPGRSIAVVPPLTNHSDGCTFKGVHMLQVVDLEEYEHDITWLVFELRALVEINEAISDRAARESIAVRYLRRLRMYQQLAGNRLWEEMVASVEYHYGPDAQRVADEIATVCIKRWAPYLGSGQIPAALPTVYKETILPPLALTMKLVNHVQTAPFNEQVKEEFQQTAGALTYMTLEETTQAVFADNDDGDENNSAKLYFKACDSAAQTFNNLLALIGKVHAFRVKERGTVHSVTGNTAKPGDTMKIKMSPVGF